MKYILTVAIFTILCGCVTLPNLDEVGKNCLATAKANNVNLVFDIAEMMPKSDYDYAYELGKQIGYMSGCVHVQYHLKGYK